MEKLKKQYIASKTKGWDEETKEKYIYELEEDFKNFYEGYKKGVLESKEIIDQMKIMLIAIKFGDIRVYPISETTPHYFDIIALKIKEYEDRALAGN